MNWVNNLHHDPKRALQQIDNNALHFFIERDLKCKKIGAVENLWRLPEPSKLIKKQLSNGSWKYHGNTVNNKIGTNYYLLETFRQLRILVDKYEFNRSHPCLQGAVEYIFSCQTTEEDIHGILSNQYMPYYMGAILSLVIKAGYADDERTIKGLNWLLSMRQQDGAWFIPLQAYKITYLNEVALKPPIPPDRSLPSSHLATGMVLRAFAEHEEFNLCSEVLQATRWLKSRFFKPDTYNDHKGAEYWTKFQYPFWWTDLLSSLDLLRKMGFTRDDADIQKGIRWFIENQGKNGLWKASYEKRPDMDLWVSLAVCRMLKRYLD